MYNLNLVIMKQKMFIVRLLEGAESKRTYVIEEMSENPQVPPRPVAVCENGDEIAQFFDNFEIK